MIAVVALEVFEVVAGLVAVVVAGNLYFDLDWLDFALMAVDFVSIPVVFAVSLSLNYQMAVVDSGDFHLKVEAEVETVVVAVVVDIAVAVENNLVVVGLISFDPSQVHFGIASLAVVDDLQNDFADSVNFVGFDKVVVGAFDDGIVDVAVAVDFEIEMNLLSV